MRRWAVLGAAGALVVTLVFAFIGDGVESAGTGPAAWIINYGHTITWALLTVTLALVAWGRAPRWLVNSIGWLALACYLVFLVTLFTR